MNNNSNTYNDTFRMGTTVEYLSSNGERKIGKILCTLPDGLVALFPAEYLPGNFPWALIEEVPQTAVWWHPVNA